jgi:Ecdysteroid kinase-like family
LQVSILILQKMDSEIEKRLNFIKTQLPKLILERNAEFAGYKEVETKAELNSHLDGFMSAIYNMELTVQSPKGEIELHHVVVKIMKGDENFRTLAKSELMCSNEVFIYKSVVPYFKKYLKDNNVTTLCADEWWTPRIFFADYDIFPGLSDLKETILAMENLKPKNFVIPPGIDLSEDHLRIMIKNIAYYHSVSYAMRIKNDPKLKEFEKSIIPLSFFAPNGEELGSYKRLFTVGLTRVFNMIEKDPQYQFDKKFYEAVKSFKDKHFGKIMTLMERFLKKDDTWSIVLHGDYNRNNVLFKYDNNGQCDAIKMIDFQEVRFGTPVIDLVFFMYMNLHYELRDKVWDNLLNLYHTTLTEGITAILKCDKNDERLKPYSFAEFIKHFAAHSFYGVIICCHYVPWIASSKEEFEKIAHHFETNMNGDEFFQICQTAGGLEVDTRLFSILKHAYENYGFPE